MGKGPGSRVTENPAMTTQTPVSEPWGTLDALEFRSLLGLPAARGRIAGALRHRGRADAVQEPVGRQPRPLELANRNIWGSLHKVEILLTSTTAPQASLLGLLPSM